MLSKTVCDRILHMSFKQFANRVINSFVDDDFRRAFSLMLLSFLLSVICAIAAIPHFIDDKEKLMAFVLVGVHAFSTIIFLLTLLNRPNHDIYRYIFIAGVVSFFAYLSFDGAPDGFLYFWILLIPAFSFITFGIFEGLICSIPMFIIILALFWTPLSDYVKYPGSLSVDFRLRITLIYIVCIIMGFVAELLRLANATRLKSINEHYEFVSLHDSLTNVANQNYLAKYLNKIYENRAEITSLGCLFIDVDGFKGVNDKYGHLFGNAVLIKIAEILTSERDAFVCRWGGDEFVICFKNIDEDLLTRVAEKYRANVSAYIFEERPSFHITISIGAVVIPVDNSFNFNHVLELADSANRKAKQKGKNIVSLAK